MLVENKFIYLNLPRCSSTSFHIACLKNELDIKYYDDIIHTLNPPKISVDADNESIADNLTHAHERIKNLKKKFGNDLPVIAVRRNPYDRYISLWKHIIDELYRVNEMETFNIFKSLKIDELMCYTENDLVSNERKYGWIKEFFNKTGVKKTGPYVTAMIYMMITPLSHYHNHDTSIKWFDISKLDELEKWVSDTLMIDFKLEKINSSQHFECSILNDEYFKKRYDTIYGNFDNPKRIKTLI